MLKQKAKLKSGAENWILIMKGHKQIYKYIQNTVYEHILPHIFLFRLFTNGFDTLWKTAGVKTKWECLRELKCL